MIEWSDKEKELLMSAPSSGEAIARYYMAFPNSERKRSSIYTYYWWRKQEEKKKNGSIESIVNKSMEILTKAVISKVKKEISEEFGKDTDGIVTTPVRNTICARIIENNIIEVGDMVKYARTAEAPVGVVISIEDKKSIPKMSQKIKVKFGNYYMRDVYLCDYKIVKKRMEL